MFDRLFALREADLAGHSSFGCTLGIRRGRWRRNLYNGLYRHWPVASGDVSLVHQPMFMLLVSRSRTQAE
jgi:hypothetical protein